MTETEMQRKEAELIEAEAQRKAAALAEAEAQKQARLLREAEELRIAEKLKNTYEMRMAEEQAKADALKKAELERLAQNGQRMEETRKAEIEAARAQMSSLVAEVKNEIQPIVPESPSEVKPVNEVLAKDQTVEQKEMPMQIDPAPIVESVSEKIQEPMAVETDSSEVAFAPINEMMSEEPEVEAIEECFVELTKVLGEPDEISGFWGFGTHTSQQENFEDTWTKLQKSDTSSDRATEHEDDGFNMSADWLNPSISSDERIKVAEPSFQTATIAAPPAVFHTNATAPGFSRNRYILGKVAGEDLHDKFQNIVIKKGEVITLRTVEIAEQEGQLAELIINMTLPGMEG